LQAATDPDFPTTTGVTAVGSPIFVHVRDGTTDAAIEGALVREVQTNALGMALLNLGPGRYNFEAMKDDSLRSNSVTIVVECCILNRHIWLR
jgi:hypothetical protein